MSPDELLWNAPQLGGLAARQWETIVEHLLRQLEAFLQMELRRAANAFIDGDESFGFSVNFWSAGAVAPPLNLQIDGTFGASVYDERWMGVQGWLYPYLQGQRLATTADGHNHIFLRYAKIDATDDDWEMAGCTGPSAWRSFGWSPDTYGEFEGFDAWHDRPDR